MFKCWECDKKYETKSGLWKHDKKVHTKQKHICDWCNKDYKYKSVLKKHKLTCKHKHKSNNEVLGIQKKVTNMKDIIKNMNNSISNEGYIEQLQNCLNEITNIQNNIQNNNNSNINIYVLGNENVLDILTDKEQKKILNKRHKWLEQLVKDVYLNEKYPELHSFIIKDIKSGHGYEYDNNKGDYIMVKKSDLLTKVIGCSINNVQDIKEQQDKKIKNTTRKIINKSIDKYNTEYEKDNSKYIKDKKKDIELLIYNERDIVGNTYDKVKQQNKQAPKLKKLIKKTT